MLSLSVKCLKCAVWLLLQHCLWMGTRAHGHRGTQIKIPKYRETNGWLPLINRDRDWRDRGNLRHIVLQLYKKQKFTDASLTFNAHNLSCFYVTHNRGILHISIMAFCWKKVCPLNGKFCSMSTQSELIMLHQGEVSTSHKNMLQRW